MSGQDALMKELFPRAKNVVWHGGGNPIIVDTNEPYNSGFKNFVTSEEMVMLVKHAEQPHRVSTVLQVFLDIHLASVLPAVSAFTHALMLVMN
jgi:hypothetical protein